MTLAPCQASWHLRTIEYRGPARPKSNPDQRPARHHAQVQTPQKRPRSPAPRQAPGRPGPGRRHDSLSGDDNPKMTHHDSPPGDENPPMTQNDSLCHASNPEMTQNDSLFQPSMTQMSQNDSHFEVSSFEMSQNDSFSGLTCPTEHPLSVADEPPATPPSPQNDTPHYKPGCGPSAGGHHLAAGPLPPGHFACRFVLLSAPCRFERSEESHPHRRDPSLRSG